MDITVFSLIAIQLQVYTRKLEEKVDWLSQLLRQEKEHSNDFMQST